MSYDKKRNIIHEQKSKQTLARNLKKKIQTTMIGSLSSIEMHFGFLWQSESLPEEQKVKMKNIFESLRSEILDKGNHQLRNVDVELGNYTVSHSSITDISFIKLPEEEKEDE